MNFHYSIVLPITRLFIYSLYWPLVTRHAALDALHPIAQQIRHLLIIKVDFISNFIDRWRRGGLLKSICVGETYAGAKSNVWGSNGQNAEKRLVHNT